MRVNLLPQPVTESSLSVGEILRETTAPKLLTVPAADHEWGQPAATAETPLKQEASVDLEQIF